MEEFDNIHKRIVALVEAGVTPKEAEQASAIANNWVDYFEENMWSSIENHLFEEGIVEESDDKCFALVKHIIGELTYELYTKATR